jgi:Uma2 family endonuclease
VCDSPQFSDDRPAALLNPLLVVEVLSESTGQRDRGEKAFYYRAMESLQAYLLVDQDRPHIEQYVRQDDGSWRFTEVASLEVSITLPTIDCTLSLSEVYERVEFPEQEDDEEQPPTI